MRRALLRASGSGVSAGFLVLVVSVVGFTFLNPWVAVFALAGAAVGLVGRRLVARRDGRNRADAKAATFDLSPPSRQPRLVKYAALALVLVAAVGVIAGSLSFATGGGGDGVSRPPVAWEAPYRATVLYTSSEFRVDEQFLLAPRLLRSITASLRRKGEPQEPLAAFRGEGWKVSSRNGNALAARERRVRHQDIGFWRPRTALTLDVPTVYLGSNVVVGPDESSTVVLKAPKHVVASTDPGGEAEAAGAIRTIALETSGSFSPTSSIGVRANSVWARNPLVQHLLGLSLWTPFVWLVGLLSALFSDAVKERLKRLLHLGRQAATQPVAEPH